MTTKAAFPVLERGGNGLELTDPGMDLRDYFAAKAMQAMIAEEFAGYFRPQIWAKDAYAIADAMLVAREAITKVTEELKS